MTICLGIKCGATFTRTFASDAMHATSHAATVDIRQSINERIESLMSTGNDALVVVYASMYVPWMDASACTLTSKEMQ